MSRGSKGWLRGAPQIADISPAYRFYCLAVMGAVTALAYVDRHILNMLLTPIQKDIGASDTAMGLLSGTAFAVFYATAAVPLARVVDLGNRRNLLSLSLMVWSVATALCGAATSYIHLLLARIGVAAGEASANPAIMSMIADLYAPNRRAAAIGTTLVGTAIGVFLGSVLGGYFADQLGWREAFLIVGLPGVMLAIVMWLTIPEPVRGASEGGLREDPDSRSTMTIIRYLLRIKSFKYIVAAKSVLQIGSQASAIWMPTYFIRVHEWSLTKTGLLYGVVLATGTICAAMIGGPLADWLSRRRGSGWYFFTSAGAVVLAIPMALGFVVAPNGEVALALLFFYSVTLASANTPSFAAALEVVRPQMRGFTTAVVNLVFNLVGAGLGGLLLGLMNDLLSARYGDQAIRYSMLLLPTAMAIAVVFYLLGGRVMGPDVKEAREGTLLAKD